MKFFSYLIVAVLAFILAITITSKDSPDAPEFDFSDTDTSYVTPESSGEFTTYYEQLTDYQKQIYNAFLEPISKGEDKIYFTNVNISSFNNNCFAATVALQYDHPEYFWFTGGYSYESSRGYFEENGDIVLTPDYYEYVSAFFNCETKMAELEKAVKQVADLARSHSSEDYERIVFVHDYLIQNAYYDHDALEDFYKTTRSPSCEYIFSAYGCLINGKTVCSGYAKAFQLVMNELGYDCIYVVGEAGEAHGWNCIFLYGEGYYVDITWDDFDLDNNAPFYNYCFITSEALARTHTLDTVYETPVCTATEYRYFIYRQYYSEKYSFDAASEILQKQVGNTAIHIQFGSLEELGKAHEELMDDQKFFKIAGTDIYDTYYYDENHYTLSFYIK